MYVFRRFLTISIHYAVIKLTIPNHWTQTIKLYYQRCTCSELEPGKMANIIEINWPWSLTLANLGYVIQSGKLISL